MRFLRHSVFIAMAIGLMACTGSDIEVETDLYEYPGDGDASGGEVLSDTVGRVVIDPHSFGLQYRFDFQPRNAQTECRFQDEDWFDCESPFVLREDSDEHDLNEGYLNFEVRAVEGEGDDERISDADAVETLVLFDFDSTIDGIDEYDEADPDYGFPDEYTASCTRSDDDYTPDGYVPDDCQMNCQWTADDLAGPVDADCSFDGTFELEFPDDDLERAFLEVEACATDFGGDQDDEHCVDKNEYLFYPAPEAFVSIDAGARHTCGIVEDDSLWCWGNNNAGQLGIDSDDSAVPFATRVEYRDWTQVSTGEEHSCGIRESGALFCWGRDDERLGFDPINNTQPEAVSPGPWQTVSAGGAHTCAIDDEGGLLCWGDNNEGQLGTGDTTDSAQPTPVSTPAGGDATAEWIDVSAGDEHTCAIAIRSTSAGGGQASYCWGNAGTGRLGNNDNSGQYTTPQEVRGDLNDFDTQVVSASIEHTCAVATSGNTRRSYCWGNGEEGRLGTGSEQDWYIPERVSNGNDYVDISAGDEHSCAIYDSGDTDPELYCWGFNIFGQLGTGESGTQPVLEPVDIELPDGVPVDQIATGDVHTCAIDTDGVLYCWGRDAQDGRLGTPDDTDSDTPTPIAWPQGEFIPTPGEDR